MRGLFDSCDYFFKFNHFQKYISFFTFFFFAELQKSILEEVKNNTSRPKKTQNKEEKNERRT